MGWSWGVVVVGKGRFTYNSIVLCACIGCKCVQLGTFNRLARRALDSEAGSAWIQKRLVQEEHGAVISIIIVTVTSSICKR